MWASGAVRTPANPSCGSRRLFDHANCKSRVSMTVRKRGRSAITPINPEALSQLSSSPGPRVSDFWSVWNMTHSANTRSDPAHFSNLSGLKSALQETRITARLWVGEAFRHYSDGVSQQITRPDCSKYQIWGKSGSLSFKPSAWWQTVIEFTPVSLHTHTRPCLYPGPNTSLYFYS